jgi:integrase
MRWADFRRTYESQYLVTLSEGSQSAWTTSANWFERCIKPRRLSDCDKAALSRFHGMLLAEELSPNSAATYLRTVRAALGWAYDMDIIDSVPTIRVRKGLRKSSNMRSRPISGEEFDRIIDAAAKVRPKDADIWQDFLRGLYLSSLRVDELRRLRWDASGDLCIDTSGKIPFIRILAEGQKNRSDGYQPMTPDFWALISKVGRPRTGYVFPLPGRGEQMTRKRVIRTISLIGKKAGVVTDSNSGKTATSHDIGRRACITRLAEKLSMSQTQAWARHSDPRTTSQFYIRHEAESLARAAGWE